MKKKKTITIKSYFVTTNSYYSSVNLKYQMTGKKINVISEFVT